MNITLSQLLNAFWLRPETALWRYLDISVMQGLEISGKSLDFGCGDGIFSFIRAGGELASDFDAFRSVGDLEKFNQKVDVYNHAHELGYIKVVEDAEYKISVGFDHKNALLQKAEKLNFYESLVLGDGNSELPFEDGEFDSIFSNIVYWLDDMDRVLSELKRILKPGGLLILLLPDVKLLGSSFYYNYQVSSKVDGYGFLELLDRGRVSGNFKQAKASEEWLRLFASNGLLIKEHKTHLSMLTLKVWDIGLRPLFPALAKVTSKLVEADRMEFKLDLMQICEQYIQPLIDLELSSAGSKKGFHCFSLTKA